MSHSLQAVREAAVDGRMHNVFTRRTQLEVLQQTLLDHADVIENAIHTDTDYTASEIAVEYLLTLRTLKKYHQSLDVESALRDEYAIARGEDAENRRDPVGIVYVVPTNYTPLYSVITAVAGAIAAGNCVVIEMPNTLGTLPGLLKRLLESTLDRSIIAFVSTPAKDEDLGPYHIRLDQNADESSKTIAVVDRTADIPSSAEAIVAASFGFGCQSPYAPDFVLVNEYVKESFLQALMQNAITFRPNLTPMSKTRSAHTDSPKKTQGIEGAHIMSTIGRATIVETHQLDLKSPQSKAPGRHLQIHTVRSLDHAIDVSNQFGNIRAMYVFAELKSAKYMTQFTSTHVSFVNHIPVELLVGPPAPKEVALNIGFRYPTSLFTVPRPQYAQPTTLSHSMMKILRGEPDGALQTALAQESRELVLTTKRHLGGGVGFFEQGILTGLGLFSSAFVVTLGSMGYLAWVTATKVRSRV